jgi:hypothetical protein
MEWLARCERKDGCKYDGRINGSCFNEWSLFVLQRYEVRVGDPVGINED